jgi:dolichyl-phosphate-mannose--protein O-mannosyl transferase
LLWFLPLVPWIVTRRDSYVYHYLPAYGFGIVLAASKLARMLERAPRAGWIGVGAIALMSVWCAPVWAEIPISRTGYELRLWFPGWRQAGPKPQKQLRKP